MSRSPDGNNCPNTDPEWDPRYSHTYTNAYRNTDTPAVTYANATSTPHHGVTPTTLGNISTRLRVETGDNVLIGGFIVTGTQPKRIIVRAIGPSLPLAGALADPVLELRNSSGGLIRSNDNWRDRRTGNRNHRDGHSTLERFGIGHRGDAAGQRLGLHGDRARR